MSLEQELSRARKDVVTDGYEMSVGEIANLYRDGELRINPIFQRYFRWDIGRKSKFIESILLGIPIPPIFVSQAADGVWELVDGLQRISTLLEFIGDLKDPKGEPLPASILEGTKALPSLSGCSWAGSGQNLSTAQKLDVKRARMRVEILKRESDDGAKYELFQRLNTGGAALTPQEVRSCVAIMINEAFHQWLLECAKLEAFRGTIELSDKATEEQGDIELVLRFMAFRRVKYTKGTDVHEYLDQAVIQLASEQDFPASKEAQVFRETFELLNAALGKHAFRRWDGERFGGKFLISVFEVIAAGTSHNLAKLKKLTVQQRKAHLTKRAKDLWSHPTFRDHSGAGVRGSDRIGHLLPLGKSYMAP
jgi:hypothetical protein